MSGDVLDKAQFEAEWRARTKLAKTAAPAPRVNVTLHGTQAQQANPGEVLQALARPLLAAALEALLEFDAIDYQPRSRRRIRRK